MNYPCPCCEYLTFDDAPPGTFGICPVCGWEDDAIQFRDPTYDGGANSVCLNQAKENFIDIGAAHENCLSSVRKPRSEEVP